MITQQGIPVWVKALDPLSQFGLVHALKQRREIALISDADLAALQQSPPADQRLCMQCGLAQLKADPDAAIGAPTEAQMVDIAAALGRAKQ